MRAYGNWCGPNWTAGQDKPTSALTDQDRNVPAIDALDEACKQHDIMLHDHPENADEINDIFIDTVSSMGITGKLFALAVRVAGPSPQPLDPGVNKALTIARNMDEDKRTFGEKYGYESFSNSPDRKYDMPRKYSRTRSGKGNSEQFMAAFGHLRGSPDTIEAELDHTKAMGRAVVPYFPREEIDAFENSPATTQAMITDGNNNDVVMASSDGGDGSSTKQVSKETPVTYHKPNYLIPDTWTVEMPVTFYFSGICRDNKALDFIFSAVNLDNILKTAIASPAADPTPNELGAPYSPGLYNQKIVMGYDHIGKITEDAIANNSTGLFFTTGNWPTIANYTVNGRSFPLEHTASAQPVPRMKLWYEKMYQYYTVLNCDYEINLHPVPMHPYLNNDLIVGKSVDTWMSGRTSNQIPNESALPYIQYWKDVQFQHIPSHNYLTTSGSQYSKIKGSYKPGSSKRMVENDGDVKLWTKVKDVNTLNEDIHLMFFPHPFNQTHGMRVKQRLTAGQTPTNGDYVVKSAFNAEVKLKYLVQYKDLVRDYSYFNGTANPDVNLLHSEFTTIQSSLLPSTL